jgi:hypothetical protein
MSTDLERDGWTMNIVTGEWSPPRWWWCHRREGYFLPDGKHLAPGWLMSMSGRLTRVRR